MLAPQGLQFVLIVLLRIDSEFESNSELIGLHTD